MLPYIPESGLEEFFFCTQMSSSRSILHHGYHGDDDTCSFKCPHHLPGIFLKWISYNFIAMFKHFWRVPKFETHDGRHITRLTSSGHGTHCLGCS